MLADPPLRVHREADVDATFKLGVDAVQHVDAEEAVGLDQHDWDQYSHWGPGSTKPVHCSLVLTVTHRFKLQVLPGYGASAAYGCRARTNVSASMVVRSVG